MPVSKAAAKGKRNYGAKRRLLASGSEEEEETIPSGDFRVTLAARRATRTSASRTSTSPSQEQKISSKTNNSNPYLHDLSSSCVVTGYGSPISDVNSFHSSFFCDLTGVNGQINNPRILTIGHDAVNDWPSIERLEDRIREVEIEREAMMVESRGYRIELARIVSIVRPNVDMESSMSCLLLEIEKILIVADQNEQEMARLREIEHDRSQSLSVMKRREETICEMMKNAERTELESLERSKDSILLNKCFKAMSHKVADMTKNDAYNSKPFSECSVSERGKRVLVVEKEMENAVGRKAVESEREREKLFILNRLRKKLNMREEVVIEKWTTQEGIQLQCLQGWSDAMMERLRSVLVRKKMNFLPSQKSMREYRKCQWNSSEWKVDHDEKGHILSQQCLTIRQNLIEQLQRCELSGNLDRSEWSGNVGYCVVFDAGGGTTKVAGTVMNSIQPNSTDHIVLLGMYKGGDGYDEMKKNMPFVIEQINELVDHPEIEILNGEGISERIHIDVLITADYKALCVMMGHSGPSSLFNCIFCKRRAGRSDNTGQVLIGNEMRLREDLSAESRDFIHYVNPSLSVHNSPLFNIPLTHIIPPALHMLMGLIKPFVTSLEDEMFQIDMKELGYCNVRTVDEAKMNSIRVKDEIDYNKEIVKSMRNDLIWIERGREELSACEKWKENQKIQVGYCSQKCIMRGKSMKRLPSEYRDTLQCISCLKNMHLYCSGAVTLGTIEINKLNPKFRCFECRDQTTDSRIEEIDEMIEALNSEIDEIEKCIAKSEKDLISLNGVIQLNFGPNRMKLEEMFEQMRISRQKYFNTFNGNDVRRMLKEENVDQLLSLSNHTQKCEIMKGMKALGRIMGAAKAKILTNAEIEQFKVDVGVYREAMVACYPTYSVTPKCHLLLAHVIPFIEKWSTWGLASEQAIEAMHATVNTVSRRYYNLKNEEHRWMLITRELSMRRKLRDQFSIFD